MSHAEAIDWTVVVQALFLTVGLFAVGGSIWWLVRNPRAVKELRRELDRLDYTFDAQTAIKGRAAEFIIDDLSPDPDQRYLDWLEGQLAGIDSDTKETRQ